MVKTNILIVEDEINIARVLQLELEHEGYVCDYNCTKWESGLKELDSNSWSLVLLDIMLYVVMKQD